MNFVKLFSEKKRLLWFLKEPEMKMQKADY